MKKIITVLTILAVLAGALFAASESHTIKITVTLLETLPAFQLTIGDVVTNNENGIPVEFVNNATYAPYIAPVAANPNAEPPVAAVAEANVYDASSDINFATNGGSVTVTAKIANAAQTTKGFTLVFSDGEFDVTRPAGAGTKTPQSIAAATTIAGGTTGITSVAVTGSTAKVQFSGEQCVANTTLATATYTYTADTAIIPGTYYADLVLTITEGIN